MPTLEDAAFAVLIRAPVLHQVGRHHGAAQGGWRCVPVCPNTRDACVPAGGPAPMVSQ